MLLSPLMVEAAATEDQVDTPELQRLWARRGTLTAPPPPEEDLLEDIFPPAAQFSWEGLQWIAAALRDPFDDEGITAASESSPPHSQAEDELPSKSTCCGPTPLDAALEVCDCQQLELFAVEQRKKTPPSALYLDGAVLKDIPARYVVPALQPHEIPVVGVWVDPRVVPGFRYRVRALSSQAGQKQRYLFNGCAKTLQSIGRGYSRRLTFEADQNTLNDNGNYFWSDSNPEGYAFEIEAVTVGDKFTLYDSNHLAIAMLEVVQLQKPQEEVQHAVLDDGAVEKTIRVRALCKAEWFDDEGVAPPVVPVDGLVVVVRHRGATVANVSRVMDVRVGSQQRRGFTLVPGVSEQSRRTTVRCADVPTCYTVTGLEPHELPVVGTYVDPRIVPGFHYRVRPAGSNRHLFGGRALCLLSIGAGYGKRITFMPDRLNEPENYFWSDSHPDGLGFEPRAVHTGDHFAIVSGGQQLGEATVFRADAAQQEESQEMVEIGNKTELLKYIHIDVMCLVSLSLTDKVPEPHVMRVSGTAVVRRGPGQTEAKLVRVENVGLSSQLNVLFVIQEAQLEFYPM